MTAHSPRDYLTIAEVAGLLGVSPATVRRWIERRRLPAYRVGTRGVRVRREDLPRVVSPLETEWQAEPHQPRIGGPAPKLTDKEVKQILAAIEGARQLQKILLDRQGGIPFTDSVEMLREMREERDRQLDALR